MEEWLREAKTLTAGRKRRLKCCSQSTTLIVSNGKRGYTAYCFRCGFKDFEPHGVRSIAQLREAVEADKAFAFAKAVALPPDFCSIKDAPEEAMLWLLQHGIGLETADTLYGVGYSPKMGRVILPVYDDNGTLQYVQARATDPKIKPKYLNQEAAAGGVVFWGYNFHSSDYVCVTEDMLSTMKIAGVHPSCSILGTNMTPEKAHAIVQRYKKIILWTDADAAGKRGRKQAMRQLTLCGAEEVLHITTELDPKKLTHQQIRKEIDKCLT